MENETQRKDGITLLEKGKKGVIRMIFSRFGMILLLLVIQVLFLFGIFFKFRQLAPHYLGFATLFYLVMIVVLVNSDHDASAKITWLIVMMVFPVFGALLYLYTSVELGHRDVRHYGQNQTGHPPGAGSSGKGGGSEPGAGRPCALCKPHRLLSGVRKHPGHILSHWRTDV